MSVPVNCGSDYYAELILRGLSRGRGSIADHVWLERMAASAAPARPQPQPKPRREHVELRATPSGKTVRLGRAWTTLRDFARESRDGRETGGFCFGEPPRWHSRVDITSVTKMIKNRCEDSATFDMEALVAEKGMLRASGIDHVDEVGSWHTHPGGARFADPSPEDLNTWLSALDFLDRSFYLGLIVTAEPWDERWNEPTVHAYVVRRREHSGLPVCEPADLLIERSL